MSDSELGSGKFLKRVHHIVDLTNRKLIITANAYVTRTSSFELSYSQLGHFPSPVQYVSSQGGSAVFFLHVYMRLPLQLLGQSVIAARCDHMSTCSPPHSPLLRLSLSLSLSHQYSIG